MKIRDLSGVQPQNGYTEPLAVAKRLADIDLTCLSSAQTSRAKDMHSRGLIRWYSPKRVSDEWPEDVAT